MTKIIMIFDSGIFMNTSNIPLLDGNLITSPLIIDEIKSSNANLIFEMFSANNVIHIESPDHRSIMIIKKEAKKIGQKGLSKPDIEILGLALQYHSLNSENVILFSDDYSLRNVAHQLNINSQSVQTMGGNERRRYRYICKACKNSFDNSLDICDICGFNKFERKRMR